MCGAGEVPSFVRVTAAACSSIATSLLLITAYRLLRPHGLSYRFRSRLSCDTVTVQTKADQVAGVTNHNRFMIYCHVSVTIFANSEK